jgi:hypothetical protein
VNKKCFLFLSAFQLFFGLRASAFICEFDTVSLRDQSRYHYVVSVNETQATLDESPAGRSGTGFRYTFSRLTSSSPFSKGADYNGVHGVLSIQGGKTTWSDEKGLLFNVQGCGSGARPVEIDSRLNIDQVKENVLKDPRISGLMRLEQSSYRMICEDPVIKVEKSEANGFSFTGSIKCATSNFMRITMINFQGRFAILEGNSLHFFVTPTNYDFIGG